MITLMEIIVPYDYNNNNNNNSNNSTMERIMTL